MNQNKTFNQYLCFNFYLYLDKIYGWCELKGIACIHKENPLKLKKFFASKCTNVLPVADFS